MRNYQNNTESNIDQQIRIITLSQKATTENNINLPKPLPNLNEWEYKPPPIFCPPTVNIKTAETLQQLLELEYGITFQTPKPGRPYPFLTPSKEY